MQLDVLPQETRAVFEYAARCDELSPFTLIGGSAFALQAGHRLSLDLDFAVFTESLPGHVIDRWISRVRRDGIRADDTADPGRVSRFRINTGKSLAQFARDYEIGGVKVTFFAHGKNAAQRRYYANADALQSKERSFSILGIEGLKVAKTLVLADRIRSRDLYDLMILIRDFGLTVERQAEIVATLGQNNDIEHYFSAMTGDLPLDHDDEGLKATGAAVSMDAVYEFLKQRIDDWQVDRARTFLTDRQSD